MSSAMEKDALSQPKAIRGSVYYQHEPASIVYEQGILTPLPPAAQPTELNTPCTPAVLSGHLFCFFPTFSFTFLFLFRPTLPRIQPKVCSQRCDTCAAVRAQVLRPTLRKSTTVLCCLGFVLPQLRRAPTEAEISEPQRRNKSTRPTTSFKQC